MFYTLTICNTYVFWMILQGLQMKNGNFCEQGALVTLVVAGGLQEKNNCENSLIKLYTSLSPLLRPPFLYNNWKGSNRGWRWDNGIIFQRQLSPSCAHSQEPVQTAVKSSIKLKPHTQMKMFFPGTHMHSVSDREPIHAGHSAQIQSKIHTDTYGHSFNTLQWQTWYISTHQYSHKDTNTVITSQP